MKYILIALGALLALSLDLAQKATTLDVWAIVRNTSDNTLANMVKEFNGQHSDVQAKLTQFENDPYKQKLLVAMGASQGPDVFFGWGGGVLESYVNAGKVYDLTAALDADPSWKNRYPQSVLNGVTFDGKVYGVPINGVQPVFFYYNKQIFQKYNLEVPTTWDELLQVVKTLGSNGVAPIALGGGSKWPDLMYKEYLVDRIGGPEAFNAVVAGRPDAWSNPAFIKANTMIQTWSRPAPFSRVTPPPRKTPTSPRRCSIRARRPWS